MSAQAPALAVHDLAVHAGRAPIVEEISLAVEPGRILGLVGESGSGKTTVALALLGYTRPGARIVGGSVSVVGEELLGRTEQELRAIRGRLVSYVSQDPSVALNPSMRVGALVRELVEFHRPDLDANAAIASVLDRVRLPSGRAFRRRYPHQLSGGQQQRLAIAMALVCQPRLVVLDEPTTGLDVVTQAHILEEVARIRDELRTAMVYVSHDLAVVAGISDRVAVMYGGRVIEDGPTDAVIREPRHPYTRGLVTSVPDPAVPRRLRGIAGVAVGVGDRPPGCPFAPRCPQKPARAELEMPPVEAVGPAHTVRCFEWRRTPRVELEPPLEPQLERTAAQPLLVVDALRAEHRGPDGVVVAADDVAFEIEPGECLALVGESGSGKTTVARCVVGIHVPATGRLVLDGAPLAGRARQRNREQRRRIQIVFQNPYDSLNPRQRVADALEFAVRRLRRLPRNEARAEVAAMLERVRLPSVVASRFPGELSGGERQRVAIARALVARPDLLVCDEVTSALDVSVQAAVLDLLAELRRDLGLAMLFITHDLGVVASVADRVLVLERGVVREQGSTEDVLARPVDAYTRTLVAAAPSLAVESERAPAAGR